MLEDCTGFFSSPKYHSLTKSDKFFEIFRYMATSGVDHTMNIWDIRNLKGPLQKYWLHSSASNLAFSQKSFLAVSLGNVVEVR